MNKSGIVGMVILLGSGISFIALASRLDAYLDPVLLFLILLSPICLSFASAGAAETARALLSTRVLILSSRVGDRSSRNSRILREMISYVYTTVLVWVLLGWGQPGLERDGSLSRIMFMVRDTLIFFLYAVVISEWILRPAARRIERDLVTMAEEE